MMAVAAWLVWRGHGWSAARSALNWFGIQLALNVLWSFLFFGMQRPGLAFAEIVALWLSIVATCLAFQAKSRHRRVDADSVSGLDVVRRHPELRDLENELMISASANLATPSLGLRSDPQFELRYSLHQVIMKKAVMSQSFDALLLVSFGGPESREDVMPFLENVTRGKNVPRERLAEVAEHYYHFGGASPINQQNRELIAALSAELSEHGCLLPIYWGNRNWNPLLPDAIRQMRDDGVQRALAFVTSAFSSYSGCRSIARTLNTHEPKLVLLLRRW